MSDTKQSAINLNTILLGIVLGVMSWVGYTTQQTSVAVAVAAEKSATHDRELLDLRQRMAAVEIKLAQYVK
jgi:uncharacterized membrane protein